MDWLLRGRNLARREWPLFVIAIFATLLMLPGLGRDHLWQDEGDTAVLGRGILMKGLPVAWDGVTLSVPDFGQRLDPNLVMVSHPWLQYYAVAASFKLFGETAFAARLPFALAGIATVLMVYRLVLALWGSRRAAATSAILLLLNVQFLLYSRQARNYTLHMLLTCLVIWQFFRLNSGRRAVVLTVLGILLFHAHPLGLVEIGVLGLLTLVYAPFRDRRRWFWPAAGTVAAYAAPWILVSTAGYEQNASWLPDVARMLPRLLQFVVECASIVPLVGIAALGGTLAVRRARETKAARHAPGPPRSSGHPVFAPRERAWLVVSAALGLAYVVAVAASRTRDVIWIEGVRHAAPIIPLTLTVTALLIERVSRRSRVVWVALMLLFGTTSLGRITPWVLWADAEPLRREGSLVGFHVPLRPIDGLVPTAKYQYVKSLLVPTPGVIKQISDVLLAQASPNDRVMTNYSWEALYFHTRLAQVLKVRPSFPIYEVVRDRLPEYVYSAKGVRWIVWRQAWEPMWGQDCERLLRELKKAGVPVKLVATLQETLYENRENLHFRRFAGGRHIFPWFENLPPVLIYRVDWPARAPVPAAAR